MQSSGRGIGKEEKRGRREGREKIDLPAVQAGMNCVDLTLSQIQQAFSPVTLQAWRETVGILHDSCI